MAAPDIFEIKRVIAERGLGFGARDDKRCGEFLRPLRHLHAAPAAAGSRLEENGKADGVCERHRLLVGGQAAVRSRHHRHAQSFGRASGFDLVAHQPDMRGLGADEMNVVLGEDFRKPSVLSEKTIARMHRIGAGDLAGGQ